MTPRAQTLQRPAVGARARARHSGPPVPRSRVIPDGVARAAKPWFIATTLIAAWLVSLLPWRAHAYAPDVLCLVIAFWVVNERRVGLLVAFVPGVLMDVHDASLLGSHALTYTLVAYGAARLHRRLQHFGLTAQALHMLPVLVAAHLVNTLLNAWVAGFWPGWDWLIATLIAAALWVPVGTLLQLPQHSDDAVDAL